ncbi:Retrovirus-related Pol polyprotein from type-2 retrotransposable element R2DM [Trichinella sp. T6]|nr:Retrovirus-related Pol polyprotein from type-2 retrotransposable element R2DM [Trichinella sp. T6]
MAGKSRWLTPLSEGLQKRWCTQRKLPNAHLISDATCGFSFATFSGYHLHQKRAHPDVFAAASGKKTKVHWSNDEIFLLATFEAGLDPACKNINQVLVERLMGYNITRRVEMIKGQRRKEQNKALVRQLWSKSETQQCVGFAGSMDSNVPVNVTTPSVVAEVAITYPEYGAVMSCDLIKQATGMAIVDINELQNNLRKVFSSGRNLPAKSHGVRESVPKKMANPRVAKFKRFQRLFRSNRRKLASHIFDKASLEQFGGSIDEASDHLEKFLSHPRLESDLYSAISGDNSIGIAHPILAEEVELELKATRPTAVGPDGIALEDIKRLNPYDIASLFNLWLKAGDLPDSVKASRTIFLPKSDGTTDISNCRPITIASALYRLFSKIITRRLAAKLELNVRQKAFQSEINGVFENTAILYALIKDAKVRSKEICITTLDLAKAFDTVPHSRIIRALRKNNVDPESVDLISKMLTGTTYAEIKGLKGKPIIIRNGVRQGDPLSPLLFEKGSLVNSWLRGTSGMRSRDYITGLKMRHCGRSSGHRETAADVAQKCLVTQALIIQRHNKIWTFDHLSEAKEVEDQLSASNSCSVKSFAEALSSKWSEAISMDMAKYLRKKLRRVDLNLNAHNVGMIDGGTSGFLPEVADKSISLERVGSKSSATRIGEKINGVGVLSTCDASGFRVDEIVGQTTPSPKKISNALCIQHKSQDHGRDLRHHLEDSLISCNSELEGLQNFIINKVLNRGIENRNKHVDAAISVLIEFLCEPKRHQSPPPPKKLTREEPKNQRQKIRSKYAQMQSLFKRDPKRVAAHLIKNQPLCNVSCPIDAAESALHQRLSQGPGVDAAPFTPKCPQYSKNILDPIFPEEVTLHLQKMKIHTSAGPDGIKVSHLRSCDPLCLAKAFNLFLLARHIPQQFKDCRTTLIPKTDDPRPDAEDYRPITVASCLYRLFSKVVTRRLEDSLSLHPRQKAFRSGTEGAFDNTSTLMTVIREAHNCGKELNIVSIDLAKEFDTVNHTSITRALRMHGLDDDSRTLITQMVTGSSTIIKGDGGALSNRIEINQGVRQGDPISPLVFNAVMAELIERLEQTGEGFKLKGVEVTTLAFADDVTLISRSHRGMEKLLSITLGFLNERGLKLNINKCKGIRLVRTPKTKSLVEDTSKPFRVPSYGEENQSIPMVPPGDLIRFLCIDITLNGKPQFDLAPLEDTFERIRKAP